MKKFGIFTVLVGCLFTAMLFLLDDGQFDPVPSKGQLKKAADKINITQAHRETQKRKVVDFKRQRSPASIAKLKKGTLSRFQGKLPSLNYRKESLAASNALKIKQQNGTTYYKLPDFFAITDNDQNRDSFPNAYPKLGHLVIEGSQRPDSYFEVLENADTGSIGVFLNEIKIKFKEGSMITSGLFDSAEVVQEYPDTGLVIVGVKNLQEAQKIKEKLAGESAIKRINFEVVEVVRSPK
jgi:hypothetical protein